jgi:2-alkyl-3-oxoalkanoate reductase
MVILISGAAGLIGGALVARLAKQGHAIIGLVHKVHEIRGNDGALVPTRPWLGAAPGKAEVATLPCEITAPGLGVSDADHDALAGDVDLIIHCAALTAFDAPLDAYEAVNVAGTAKMLSIAPSAGFLYVSTAYVCGVKNGAIDEGPRDEAFAFGNGYERSKASAEALVRGSDRETVIARPGIVVGEHGDGSIRAFDTIYAAFRLIAEGRITALPATGDATLDFVPIDHVIGGLSDIVAHWPRAVGQTFHLTSGAPITPGDFGAAIARIPGLMPPSYVRPEDFDVTALPPLERRLYKRVASLYASYFQRSPGFTVGALTTLSGRVCPPVDAAALNRMIRYCLERGFLTPDKATIK